MDYQKYHRDEDYLKNENLFRNIFTTRFNILKRFIKKPGKVLDIGTSTGVMLDIFKEHGWQTWGVEPSESALVASNKGHKVVHSYFEDATFNNNFFDLVILNHTLEHLDNPIGILTKAGRILKKGGIIFVDVPNFGGLSSKFLKKSWPYLAPEEHKHQFTKQSLSQILEKSGFNILYWKSRSGIFEYANPLRELKRKRFLLDILLLPYSLIVTMLNMGDSMSFVAKKK